MISSTRFSLARFSANPDVNLIIVEVSLTDDLVSVAGVAVPVSITSFMTEVLSRGQARGTIAKAATFEAAVSMIGKVNGNANILVQSVCNSNLLTDVFGCRNEVLNLFVSGDVNQSTWGSKTMPFHVQPSEVLAGGAFASKNIIRGHVLDETLNMLSEAGLQGTDEVSITVSIPPGGELRIDSETFRVLLDGENVLHEQHGSWIKLSREVLYVDIEAATGGDLTGGLLYQERWL